MKSTYETPTTAAEPAAADSHTDDVDDHEVAVHDGVDNGPRDAVPAAPTWSPVRLAVALALVVAVALATLIGWLGLGAYHAHQAQQKRDLFVQAGRQGALNLTTIDWQHADTDAQRILDSATGTFYDDFSKREQPFIEIVKKAQSKSTGTITEAGVESETGDDAQVLVAVSVQTSNIGAAQQEPQAWRLRISVAKVGDEVKVSNVVFVP